MPRKIPIAFYNESNYDYHFIIKELAEEDTEKYITFIVPTEKEIPRIDNNGEEITKNISNIL